MFYNVGTVIVTSGFYWISAGLYAIMDYTQKPAFFMKYKIQPTKNIPPDTKRVLKVTLKGHLKEKFKGTVDENCEGNFEANIVSEI